MSQRVDDGGGGALGSMRRRSGSLALLQLMHDEAAQLHSARARHELHRADVRLLEQPPHRGLVADAAAVVVQERVDGAAAWCAECVTAPFTPTSLKACVSSAGMR